MSNLLVTKQQNEVTIFSDGSTTISQRKLARLLSVSEGSLTKHVSRLKQNSGLHQNANTTNGLDENMAFLVVTHYAYVSTASTQEAKDFLHKLGTGGMRAYNYHEAGYVVSAAPIRQVALPEDYVSALRALADKEEQRVLLMAENQEKHIETDSSTDYFTVRKIRSMNPDMKIDGKILGKVANIFNQPAKQVFDLYEQPVNTYTRTVWEEAYPDAELP